MPSPITATLSPREREIALAWFADITTTALIDGTDMFEKGAVISAYWCDDHAHLHGAVKAGGKLREQTITYEDDDSLSSECDCPARYNRRAMG